MEQQSNSQFANAQPSMPRQEGQGTEAEKYEEIDALSGLQQPLQLFIHNLLLSSSRLTESIGSFIIAKRVRSRNCFSDQIRRKKMFTKINVYFYPGVCYTMHRIARVGRPGRQI